MWNFFLIWIFCLLFVCCVFTYISMWFEHACLPRCVCGGWSERCVAVGSGRATAERRRRQPAARFISDADYRSCGGSRISTGHLLACVPRTHRERRRRGGGATRSERALRTVGGGRRRTCAARRHAQQSPIVPAGKGFFTGARIACYLTLPHRAASTKTTYVIRILYLE